MWGRNCTLFDLVLGLFLFLFCFCNAIFAFSFYVRFFIWRHLPDVITPKETKTNWHFRWKRIKPCSFSRWLWLFLSHCWMSFRSRASLQNAISERGCRSTWRPFQFRHQRHGRNEVWLKCCFTSTETVGLLRTGAQDGHLDFHTAQELWYFIRVFYISGDDRRTCQTRPAVSSRGWGVAEGFLQCETLLSPCLTSLLNCLYLTVILCGIPW